MLLKVIYVAMALIHMHYGFYMVKKGPMTW